MYAFQSRLPSRFSPHNHAVLQGLMRVIECDWPVHYKNTDGICLAELL